MNRNNDGKSRGGVPWRGIFVLLVIVVWTTVTQLPGLLQTTLTVIDEVRAARGDVRYQVIDAGQMMAPAQPPAVRELPAATAVSPTLQPVQPAVPVVPAVPAAPGATPTLTLQEKEFILSCYDAQQAGRRASPACPPNPAALLGTGR